MVCVYHSMYRIQKNVYIHTIIVAIWHCWTLQILFFYLPPYLFWQNRISQDSGFISQQLTPTPPLSPCLTIVDTEANTVTNGNASQTTPPPSQISTTVQNTNPTMPNALSVSMPPSRSKSTDALHRLVVSPSTPPRSPSMEFPGKRRHSSQSYSNSPLVDTAASKKQKKKERGASEKKNKTGLFSFNRSSRVKDSTGSAGGGGKEKVKQSLSLSMERSPSPQTHRTLEQTVTDNSLDRTICTSSELTRTLHT